MVTADKDQIRGLLFWNRFWLAVCVFMLLVSVGGYLINQSMADLHKLRARWEADGSLRFSSMSDGPFVITHLVAYTSTEGGKAVAALPEPIAIIDSEGAKISSESMKKLLWHYAISGGSAPMPDRANISALYYRPERAKTIQIEEGK